jgi:hypothetical protein
MLGWMLSPESPSSPRTVTEKLVERSPDKRPSESGFYIEDRGPDVIAVLRLADGSALVIRGNAPNEWHGVSIFTKDQIQFD